MTSSKDQIIQTTCDLLESQGYHATGLNQIVKDSGAPKGSLYYYFPEGKEQIAAEALQHVTEMIAGRIRENLKSEPDAAEAVRSFAYTIAHHIEASGFRTGGPLMTVALETATTNEHLNQVCRAAYEQMRAAFEEKLLDSGVSAESASPLSVCILAAMEGGILLSRTYHSGDPLRQVGDHLAIVIREVSNRPERTEH